MPILTIRDWSNGPMGPGFFVLFPAAREVSVGSSDPLPFPVRGDDRKRKKRIDELVALMLLMREQE